MQRVAVVAAGKLDNEIASVKRVVKVLRSHVCRWLVIHPWSQNRRIVPEERHQEFTVLDFSDLNSVSIPVSPSTYVAILPVNHQSSSRFAVANSTRRTTKITRLPPGDFDFRKRPIGNSGAFFGSSKPLSRQDQ
jgi:hypothetical protein